MKAIRYIAILILAAALAACGEKSEPYYTTSYPVSRVEATVTLGAAATATAEDEPEPEPEPETVTFTVQKGQTNCDNCKFKSLCYDANIELVHLLKCNVYDLNSITEVEQSKQ